MQKNGGLRIDTDPLRGTKQQKAQWEKTDNGIYRFFGTIGKAMLKLPYYRWDGKNIVKEIEVIEKEELFREDSMLSAFGKPIVLGHTPDGLFHLNKDGLQVGSTLQEYRIDEVSGDLSVLLAIQDHKGIALIDEELSKGRIPQLSPTYDLESIKLRSDGTYAQIGRAYDNIALLREGHGRGGDAIALRMDSNDLHLPTDTRISQYFFLEGKNQESKKVADLAIRIDGSDRIFRDVDDELASQVKQLLTRVDSLGEENQTLKTQVSTVTAQLDGTKVKLTEAEKALESANSQRMDDNAIAAELQKRGEVWEVVEPFLKEFASQKGKEFRRDNKLGVEEIKSLFIRLKAPHLNLDGKDDDYINAIWDCLKPQPGEKPPNSGNQATQPQSRVDAMYEWLSGSDSINQGKETPKSNQRSDGAGKGGRERYTERISNGNADNN